MVIAGRVTVPVSWVECVEMLLNRNRRSLAIGLSEHAVSIKRPDVRGVDWVIVRRKGWFAKAIAP
jgi:hypothetical protein